MNAYWVLCFEGSWVEDISRDMARGSFSWMALVDLMFFCWLQRWHFLTKHGIFEVF